MGNIRDRERREADLFYADLLGIPMAGRRRRALPDIEAEFAGETPEDAVTHVESDEDAFDEGGIDPARVFDEVVQGGVDPTPLLAEAEEEVAWEAVALPNSATPPDALQPGALVVTRALGEGRLAFLEVLGEDIQVESLYADDNRIRPDVLVLDRRSTARPSRIADDDDTIESWVEGNTESAEAVGEVAVWENSDTLQDPEVIDISETLPETALEDIRDGLELLERIDTEYEDTPTRAPTPTRGPTPTATTSTAAPSPMPSPAPSMATAPAAAGVTIAAAPGLGTSRTVAPIATVSPQRQMNEVLDRELILFAKGRILAEWVDRNLSATFEQAFNDTRLRAALNVSRDRALLDKLRPFPERIIPPRRHQLFTSDAVLNRLLQAPGAITDLWPIFDVLHYYGVVLLPQTPNAPSARPSVMASITRVDGRLDRARFDRETAAIERHAVRFKQAVGNKHILHHAVDREAIPPAWAAGKRERPLYVATHVVALLRRLRAQYQRWRAGTYAGHWWNDFSVDVFLSAELEPSGFWRRDRVRLFFRALNEACEQDVPPGRFAWKGIYNDAGLAQEMNALYGSGRVLSGVEGHGPGPRMHVHLDVRPLTVPFDSTTGVRLDGPRVVLIPQSTSAAASQPTPAPIQVRAREDEDIEDEDIAIGEAVPNAGRGRFRHDALGGDGNNVEARWNVEPGTASGSTIDIVVYLHGYGAPSADFLARKAQTSGLNLVDSSGAVRVRASRPTLALIPRGRNTSGSRWVFDKLSSQAAFDALVDAGLSWLCTTVLRLLQGSTLSRGRVTLIAHSGGGQWLSALLAGNLDPDEVICFDSLYGGEAPVARWATARIRSPRAAQSGLRAFYTPCHAGSWAYWTSDKQWHLISTEVAARRLKHAVDQALSGATDPALANRFRVERTSVGHSAIPARYSSLLLNDIAATVPDASPPPPSTSRPSCVANDDWLTQSPHKPGGMDPPARKP